jgi:thiamine biosynthesis lipoprotein
LASLRPLIVLALAAGAAGGNPAAKLERVESRTLAAPARYEYAQVHMGMPVRLQLYADGEDKARSAASAAFARIAALDRMMSDYRPDSALRRLPSDGTWTAVSLELFDVLRLAVEIARATRGAFDPTIAPLVSIWRDARANRRLPAAADLDRARTRVGWRRLQLDSQKRAIRFTAPDMRLDLGGIAKGYILQEARGVLRSEGIAAVLIEAGGDIVAGDAPPGRDGWTIDVGGARGAFKDRAARLANAALATSGSTTQYLEAGGVRYSHVIDPRTGFGVTHALIARVIVRDAATADALATAFSVIGSVDASILAHFPGAIASLDSK